MSARYPGATSPRSNSRNARAALQEPARKTASGSQPAASAGAPSHRYAPPDRISGRIPVVGAEEEERRTATVSSGRSRSRFRPADPSRSMTAIPRRSFSSASARVSVSWQLRIPAAQVSIQRPAGEQRRVTVDVPVLEERELFQDAGVSAKHARHIHHLGQPGTPERPRYGARSAAESSAPAVSNGVAGTQPGSWRKRSMAIFAALSKK